MPPPPFRVTRRSSLSTSKGRKRRQQYQESLAKARRNAEKRRGVKQAKLFRRQQQVLDEHLKKEDERSHAKRIEFTARCDELAHHIETSKLDLLHEGNPHMGLWTASTALVPGQARPAWEFTFRQGCAPSLQFWGRSWAIDSGADICSVLDLMSTPASLCAGIDDLVAAARIDQQGHVVKHIVQDEEDNVYRSVDCQIRVPFDATSPDDAAEVDDAVQPGTRVTASMLKSHSRVPAGDPSPALLGHFAFLPDGVPGSVRVACVAAVTYAEGSLPAHVCLRPYDLEDVAVPFGIFSRDWQVSTVFCRRSRMRSLRAMAASPHASLPSCPKCQSAEHDAKLWVARRVERHDSPEEQKRFTAATGNTIKQSILTPNAAKKRQQNKRKRVSRLTTAEKNTASFALRRVRGLDLDQTAEVLAEGKAILRDHERVLDAIIEDTPPEFDKNAPYVLESGEIGTYQAMMKEAFVKDVRGRHEDEHRNGGSFSDATFRLMFAVWARCPAAAKAFRHHSLHRVPAEKTMRAKAQAGVGLTPGMPQAKIVRRCKELREKQIEEMSARLGKDHTASIPNEWQLIADEVKLTASGIGFTTQGGRLRGTVTTVSDGCTDLHDFYRAVAAPPETVPIAKYALCVSLRCMARPSNHAIMAFVMTEGNISSDFTINTLLSCITVVQSHDMNVFSVIMDGSSVNIKAFKALLGLAGSQLGLKFHVDPADPHRFKTAFVNPDNADRVIYLTVCADHCLKRQVRALYDSHPRRHRRFRRPVAAGGTNTTFGFLPVEQLWETEKDDPHKVANLGKRVVDRDRISDLSVPLALETCKRSVVTALKLRAENFVGHARDECLETAAYLDHLCAAYHNCLLDTRRRLDCIAKLDSVDRLYRYYNSWLTALEKEGSKVLSSKSFKEGIAYQTYENVRFMVFSSHDMLEDWLHRYPEVYLTTSVFTTSILESQFGQMKGQEGGNLLAVNMAGALLRLNARQFYDQPALKRSANGQWSLNARVDLV